MTETRRQRFHQAMKALVKRAEAAYAARHPEMAPLEAKATFFEQCQTHARKIMDRVAETKAVGNPLQYLALHPLIGSSPWEIARRGDFPSPLPSVRGVLKDIIRGEEPNFHAGPRRKSPLVAGNAPGTDLHQ